MQWRCEMLHQYMITHSGTHGAAAPFCTESPACHGGLCGTITICETPVSLVAVFGGEREGAVWQRSWSKDILEEGLSLSPRHF